MSCVSVSGKVNQGGTRSGLRHQSNTYVVKSLLDGEDLPMQFDTDTLFQYHRGLFDSSNVTIHSFVNVVYLIYKFLY